jgi:hypothetical protein
MKAAAKMRTAGIVTPMADFVLEDMLKSLLPPKVKRFVVSSRSDDRQNAVELSRGAWCVRGHFQY